MTLENLDDIIPHDMWRVTVEFSDRVTGEQAQLVSDALEEHVLSVLTQNRNSADGDDWTVTLTTMGHPDLKDLHARVNDVLPCEQAALRAEKLPVTDWLQHVHENFPPINIGSFFVYGSHYEGEKPEGKTALLIDAATAFGSGEHETTKGCLEALETLKATREFKNGLDMGCGSGILAIAMTKLWPDIRATAVDIDPESVTVTKRHAAVNGATIETQAGDGYAAPIVSHNGRYDIITANILAGPLVDMAPDLAFHLENDGYAVLSGLLNRQKHEVVEAHEECGLTLIEAIQQGDWQALVFHKHK